MASVDLIRTEMIIISHVVGGRHEPSKGVFAKAKIASFTVGCPAGFLLNTRKVVTCSSKPEDS